MLRSIVLPLLLAAAVSANAEIVDTRSKAYQDGTFHLSQAQQSLVRAITELKKAEAFYDFPGLNITRMIGQIQEVEETTTLILSPERRRIESKTLVPDGTFFQPIQ